MPCEEKRVLGVAYDAATKTFSTAVSALQEQMGVSSKTEYDRLTRAANTARATSEHARLALEAHISTHHC
jgi:hypothetical protein